MALVPLTLPAAMHRPPCPPGRAPAKRRSSPPGTGCWTPARCRVGDGILAGTAKEPRVAPLVPGRRPTAISVTEPGDTIVVRGSDSGKIALPAGESQILARPGCVGADATHRAAKVPPGLPVPAGAVVRIARRTTSTLLGEAS